MISYWLKDSIKDEIIIANHNHNTVRWFDGTQWFRISDINILTMYGYKRIDINDYIAKHFEEFL